VIQEVLQGVRDQPMFEQVREGLCALPYLPADREVYLAAADLYREIRRKGMTVPPRDVTIAAIAIRHHARVYTIDRHFEVIARHSVLTLFHP
jgi:predicted nucleic acid-binding protein